MSLQVEKLENNMAKLTIEVSAEELEKAIQRAYLKNRNRISIPGFRKGKAPRKMLEQMYGKNLFYEDAANDLVPKAYEEAYDECTEEIVSAPQFDIVQMEAGKPFIFTAEVALKPEVTLGQYKGIRVEKEEITVTDEEVMAQIDRERDKNARILEITDRAVQEGDIATIDFKGFMDGVAFHGGEGKDHPLTIGSHEFIPGFEEGLIGAKLNQETEVNVTFPEDYQTAELAGKAAVFKCTVKKLQKKELPDFDEDFVGEVSEESDTIEEYKEEIRKNLTESKEEEAEAKREEAILDAVIADAKMDIPEAMVETQQRQILQEYAQRLRYQGVTFDQYMQFTGMTREEFLEQVKPQAMNKIQTRLVLEAVAAAENLTASEEEVDEELKNMSEVYQTETDKILERMGKDGRKQLEGDICVRKAADFLVENAVEA